MTRRRAVTAILGGGAALAAGGRIALPRLLRRPPPRPLEGEARAFASQCFEGLDRARLWDGHAHLLGLGAGGTHCAVSPDLRSHLRPVNRARFDVLLAVSGVDDVDRADALYLERLLALHRLGNPQAKVLLLAFDLVVDEDGHELPERSEIYTPNDYVLDVADRNNDVAPGVSIHPYRRDAVARLERAHARGARAVKWLPSAMAIDPASPLCDRFYRSLAELRLPLISHAGKERAVTASAQHLANPLRLRRALESGVRVVVAHCASTGVDEDLEAPGRPPADSFDLFMRLMREPQYVGRLYGDLSAVTQVNRCGRPLRELLQAGDLHHRLVNGSDWPLPAVDPLFSTRRLVRNGYLTAGERLLCNQVFEANPLLFDFVVKRTIKVEAGDVVHRFAGAAFESARLFQS